MSYAIKTGTTEAHWIDQASTPVGCVRFEGEIKNNMQTGQSLMVWDDKLNNIRDKTPTELEADATTVALRLKRESVKAQVVEAMVDSILSGKIPSDPVMADVAIKVVAENAKAEVLTP